MSNAYKNSFPKLVGFQTHSFCNSKCIFCPYSRVYKKLSNGFMSETLFKKIINECTQYNIDRIIPYLNNEPFLDIHYITRLKYIRDKLPDTFVELSTNAELLNDNIINSLMDLEINEVRLSIFGFEKETYNALMVDLDYDKVFYNVKRIIELKKGRNKTNFKVIMLAANIISNEEINKAVAFYKDNGLDFEKFDILDRAGNLDNVFGQFSNQKINGNIKGCKWDWPNRQVNILFNGDVISCCNDWSREFILGNITCSSIYDLWNSISYENFWSEGFSKYGCKDHICKRCTVSY